MGIFPTRTFGLIITLIVLFHSAAHSAGVIATVQDDDGNLIEYAVVSLIGNDVAVKATTEMMSSPVMSQQNIQFTPFVLPVAVGTTVSFPNKDDVRHHVYSFSKVKRFEFELYGGDEDKSVLFDKSGVVALGCNIHDGMLAYIYISPSNIFSTTKSDGSTSLYGLGAGTYKAYVWHPRLKGDSEDYMQEITISDDGTANMNFTISLKRERKRKRKGNY